MFCGSWVGGESSEKIGIGEVPADAGAVATRVVCYTREECEKGPDDDLGFSSRPRPFASWTSFSPFLRAGLSSSLRPSSYTAIASSYCLEPWRAAPFRAYPFDHEGLILMHYTVP